MCDRPWVKRDTVAGVNYDIPCGKCPSCTSRRASAWSFRLMQEERVAHTAYFLTLTYSDGKADRSSRGYLTLSKRHPQLFFKRLRYLHEQAGYTSRIRYYLCGEYGGQTMRPHYHAIIFDAHPNLIEQAWHYGNIHVGNVSEASVGYTLKYISKTGKIPQHSNDDRQKEFSLMSKRLGTAYLTPEMIAWHKAKLTDRMYCNLTDGKKITMPRYYKNKIYDDNERLLVSAAQVHRASQEIDMPDTSLEFDAEFHRRFLNQESSVLAAYARQSYLSDQNQKL